jgi:hypothetical protein
MATTYASIRAAAGLSSKAVRNAPISKSYTPYVKPVVEPFGPQVANDIFENWGEDCEPAQLSDYGDSYDTPETVEEYWYQQELPLESLRELEERHRNEINKFQRTYKKMMVYALQWHYLIEECEENPQLDKMFRDLQLVRKLSGSDKL